MSIQPPQGILTIPNATLRVGKLAVTSNLEVGSSNLFVDTVSGRVGVGTNTPLDTLHINGGTRFAGHIIPTANATFDIGEPENKIRDIYIDTNSLWIGDLTKIAFERGKMKFKRRKTNKVPTALVSLATSHVSGLNTEAEVQADAVTFAQTIDPTISAVEDLKLEHWRDYAKTFDETKAVSDIFIDNDEDYEAVTASEAFMEVGSNIFTEHSLSIGKTTDPTARLDVVGDISFTGNLYQNGTLFEGGGGGVWTETGNDIYYNTGNVGVGLTNPSHTFHVEGNIYASGNVTAYSDKRKKTNLRIIEDSIKKLEKINGYIYEKDGVEYTGLIAQEVLPILPQAVVGSENDGYGLAYGNMVGILVEAIKELSNEVKILKEKLSS